MRAVFYLRCVKAVAVVRYFHFDEAVNLFGRNHYETVLLFIHFAVLQRIFNKRLQRKGGKAKIGNVHVVNDVEGVFLARVDKVYVARQVLQFRFKGNNLVVQQRKAFPHVVGKQFQCAVAFLQVCVIHRFYFRQRIENKVRFHLSHKHFHFQLIVLLTECFGFTCFFVRHYKKSNVNAYETQYANPDVGHGQSVDVGQNTCKTERICRVQACAGKENSCRKTENGIVGVENGATHVGDNVKHDSHKEKEKVSQNSGTAVKQQYIKGNVYCGCHKQRVKRQVLPLFLQVILTEKYQKRQFRSHKTYFRDNFLHNFHLFPPYFTVEKHHIGGKECKHRKEHCNKHRDGSGGGDCQHGNKFHQHQHRQQQSGYQRKNAQTEMLGCVGRAV